MKNCLFYLARFLFFTVISLLIFLWAKGIYYDSYIKKFNQVGIISLETYPKGAEVYINKKLFGKTPAERISLQPGIYDVEVKKEGFETWQKSLEVYENEINRQNLLLLPAEIKASQEIIPGASQITVLPAKDGFIFANSENKIFIRYRMTDE